MGGAPPTDDWNKFDTPALRGISKTAPYFHNNSAATLGDVVDHYIEFFKRVKANAAPGVVPPVATTDGVNFDRAPLQKSAARFSPTCGSCRAVFISGVVRAFRPFTDGGPEGPEHARSTQRPLNTQSTCEFRMGTALRPSLRGRSEDRPLQNHETHPT